MNAVRNYDGSTYIDQDSLTVSVVAYEPGKRTAAVLVRASECSGKDFRSAISAGFDLTADSAEHLAAALLRLAKVLRDAEVPA